MIQIIPLPPNRVWRTYTGGKMLDILNDDTSPRDSHFPEDWIASLTRAVNPGREHLSDEGLSHVNVDSKKVLFKQIVEEDPEGILGKEHYLKYGLSAGFLLKFLDSAIRLHIQCHPTVAFARKYLNYDHGKTEGYYILGTREEVENPYIYLGFQNPPPKERLKEAIEKQDIDFLESCFEKIPVKRGDAFLVPGGLSHAIGEGVFMIEIMEPTDLVVRIEFEKAGYVLPVKARFMDRGIDFCLSMFNFEAIPAEKIKEKYFIKHKLRSSGKNYKEFSIFDKDITDRFRMEKVEIKGATLLRKESFYIAIVIEGKGELESCNEKYNVKTGDKFFIPASTREVQVNTSSHLVLILALPPE